MLSSLAVGGNLRVGSESYTIAIFPKAFFAVLGILVPDPTAPSDQNSDPFWMKNTDEFFYCWVCVSFQISPRKWNKYSDSFWMKNNIYFKVIGSGFLLKWVWERETKIQTHFHWKTLYFSLFGSEFYRNGSEKCVWNSDPFYIKMYRVSEV